MVEAYLLPSTNRNRGTTLEPRDQNMSCEQHRCQSRSSRDWRRDNGSRTLNHEG